MRLIDANDFFKRMENDIDLCAEMEEGGLKALKKYLDMQPTAYNIDKVVAELEERSKEYNSGIRLHGKPEEICTDEAIEIVKQGGVSDDVCEWKLNGVYLISPHPLVSLSCITDYGYRYNYCPVCGKKIKVVE